jgi:hypothetical protein
MRRNITVLRSALAGEGGMSDLSPAKEALADRDRLYRRYRKRKEAAFKELCARDPDGARLRQFARHLNSFRKLEEVDAFLTYLIESRWLRRASDDCMFAAIDAVANRITDIRTAHHLAPFDDPLPGSGDDAFQIAKQVLTR